MKKILLIVWFLLSVMSYGKVGKTYAVLFQGYQYCNDLYLISFNGYVLPVIADDLYPGDKVIYYSPLNVWYLPE